MLSITFLLFLVSDATGIPRVNTTVGKSTILPCLMNTTITDLRNLRFYWQDENNKVLYSFDQGTEVPKYVDRLYRGRITAFHQDMRRGNVSIKLENTTMEDNNKVFDVFGKVFGTMEYGETNQICQLTLHVDGKEEHLTFHYRINQIEENKPFSQLRKEKRCSVFSKTSFVFAKTKVKLHFLSHSSKRDPDYHLPFKPE